MATTEIEIGNGWKRIGDLSKRLVPTVSIYSSKYMYAPKYKEVYIKEKNNADVIYKISLYIHVDVDHSKSIGMTIEKLNFKLFQQIGTHFGLRIKKNPNGPSYYYNTVHNKEIYMSYDEGTSELNYWTESNDENLDIKNLNKFMNCLSNQCALDLNVIDSIKLSFGISPLPKEYARTCFINSWFIKQHAKTKIPNDITSLITAFSLNALTHEEKNKVIKADQNQSLPMNELTQSIQRALNKKSLKI